MVNRSKAKGTQWETDFRDYARAYGADIERLPLHGTLDQGDNVIREAGHFVVVSNKAVAKYDIPKYLREVQKQAEIFRAVRGLEPDKVSGVLALKLRLKPVGQCAIITTVDDYLGISG